jgi:hypothetical protein
VMPVPDPSPNAGRRREWWRFRCLFCEPLSAWSRAWDGRCDAYLDYSRDLRPTKWGAGTSLHSSNPDPLMSALGQKRTSQGVRPMSALPPKADIG